MLWSHATFAGIYIKAVSSCHPSPGLKKKWKEVILKITKLISFSDSPNDVPVIQFCIHDRRNHPGLKLAGPFLLEALPTNSMQSKLPASKSS